MASYTDNYNLRKIDLTDAPPDITVLNQNWDILDQTLESKMNKHLLQYDGDIKENGVRLTFPVLYNMLLNTSDFVVLVNDGEALHPNIVNNNEIVFVSVDPDNTGLTGRKITMINNGFSTVTLEEVTTVPSTRKINNKELSSDIVLNPSDVGLGDVLNNPNNIATYSHLNQLGLSDSDFSSTDFSANFTKLLSAMPTHARLVCTTGNNFKNALVAKILADTGFTHDGSSTYVINVTKTGSGIYQIASLRANEMYTSYVGREYSVFRYISSGNVTTDTRVIFTSSTDGGFATRLKRSYNTLAQIGLSDASFVGKTYQQSIEALFDALGTTAELVLDLSGNGNLREVITSKINSDNPLGFDISAGALGSLKIETAPSKFRSHTIEIFPDSNYKVAGYRCAVKSIFEWTNVNSVPTLQISPFVLSYDPYGFVTTHNLASKVQALMESGDISMLMSPISIKSYYGQGTRTGTGKGRIFLGSTIHTNGYSSIVIDGKNISPTSFLTYIDSIPIEFTQSFSISCNESNCDMVVVFY